MPESNLEAIDVLEALESKLAYLPGGRDREGRPVLIVNILPQDTQNNSVINDRLEKLLKYLLEIFNAETKRNGICLIVDARKGCWRVARSFIRRSMDIVGQCAGRTIVIRADGFWEKRVDNCTKSWKDGEPIYVPIARLNSYVDSSQITHDLNGTKYYEHSDWIHTRVRVEEYEKNAKDLIGKLTEFEEKLNHFDQTRDKQEHERMIDFYWETGKELEGVARHIIHSGKILASAMSVETSQDFQDMIHGIHDLLDIMESKQAGIENGWSRIAANLDLARELNELEDGVAKVTNWILGPADSMLNCHWQVGFDVTSSENIRREHEELELECRETYGRYAKLLHRIDSVPDDCLTEDFKSQRDFMNFVCRSFATRLERRRNVLITSQRFFRLVSEYFDKTSEVFDNMILGNRACSFPEAEEQLKNLGISRGILDGLLVELIKEGEKLSDILSMPVKDALGRDVDVDYVEDIANIRDILDATNARKNIFNDSMELQKLTLKQIFLIHAYENDAEQAVKWLTDLFGVLVENHVEIGCNAHEIQMQKEELQSVQETAQGTFDYGCQLLNGARVLRISSRLTLDANTTVFAELRRAWRRLCSIGQEQLTRLRVCTVFHRSVDEHCSALNELIVRMKNSLLNSIKPPLEESSDNITSFKGDCMREVLKNRETLLVDVGRTVRLGRLLRTRLREPLHLQLRMFKPEDDVALTEHENLTAVDAISERLAEVTRLAEKLDAKLYEAGARTRISKKHEGENVEHGEASSSRTISPACFSSPVTVTKLSCDKKEPDNDEKINEASPEEVDDISEEINTENYMTATECSTTPVPRSRSESFITISECDDAMSEACRLGAAEVLEEMHQNIESSVLTDTSEGIHEPEIMNKSPSSDLQGFDINRNGIAVNKTYGTSIVEKVEEQSGKIVKEITEITTLRVSHDTKFGVASYKFTSNMLTENREETNAKGVLDVSSQCLNGNANGLHRSSKDDTSKCSREEMSYSKVDTNAEALDNGYHFKQSAIIKEVTEHENHSSPNMNGKLSLLTSRRNNDSGIEMTPRKIDGTDENEDEDENEFFEKLKMSGEWLRLKVLEVHPELTKLGTTVDEAKKLSAAHDEVLIRLQSKQSPVEELLRQADQLISTQRPRAEVYAAMAETLGQAWQDVNSLLQLQKQILDHNVLFQCRAEEFRLNAKALEITCNDTLLPIEIDLVKKFLTRIHDLRKAMLNSLMGALQEGRALLDCLREIANEGTLDSRPDRIKADADNAVLQVEKWLEELHDQRTFIELSVTSRKTQLEQCLALALLATDLRDLEEILTDRIAALSASSDQLGDSPSSAEILLFELKKLQLEAKDFQDRSLKITKSTETLVSSKHFAGEQATEQAYAILGTAADYINDLDQYEILLNKAIAFFQSARSAFTKLDQLEIQLTTTEHPLHSPQLARFHAQTASTLSDVTAGPLAEGYALLDVTGRGAPGAEGVKHTVEELENRKIQLLERCTAHKEENLRIAQGLASFFEKYDELSCWLSGIANAFLRGHQDMGSDLPMAQNFYKIHCQLLEDLGKRGDEIDEALAILSGTIMSIPDENQQNVQKRHVEDRVDALRDSWLDTRHSVEARLTLIASYVDFHEAAAVLTKEVDDIENEFKKNADNIDEENISQLEKRWNDLRPLYVRLTSSGATFLSEADKCTDAYLDIPRARLCVETTLERFASRQLTVTESWENWQTTVVTTRERRIEHERRIEESTKTLAWASKFCEQLYPILTSESTKPSVLLQDLESIQLGILPELKKAVTELEARIKSVSSFTIEGDKGSDIIKEKLSGVYEQLRTTAADYQSLLESLIAIFQDFILIENQTDETKRIRHDLEISTSGFLSESGRNDIRSLKAIIEKIHASVEEILKNVEPAIDRIILRIDEQEPPLAAKQENDKLKQVFETISRLWQNSCMETKRRLDKRLLFCNFADDLDRIDSDLRRLSDQLAGSTESGHRFTGDSLFAIEAASEAFTQFEETVTVLEERINTFVKTTENNVELKTPESAPVIIHELSKLQERWNQLKRLSEATRERINSSIEYFQLLEEAKSWYQDGNKFLITIARKSSAAKTPAEVSECLEEINHYLKCGEEPQENRIEKIRELSTNIFGTDRLPQFSEVVVHNRETLDSFAIVISELRTLAQNLKNTEEMMEEKRREKEHEENELRKLNAARAEAQAAYEAEIARKKIEADMEQKRKQERALTSSVSAQTEIEREIEKVVEETVTSAVTTKEIQLLQKTEIEEAVPVLVTPIPQVYTEVELPVKVETKKKDIAEIVAVSEPPRFLVPLDNATVEEGNRFTFECQLDEGVPKSEIIWYKDGISILNNPDYLTCYNDQTGVCTLTIEETFAEDNATFTCKAFNTAGLAETGATLKIKVTAPDQQLNPPIFIRELLSCSAKKGSPHLLSCMVKGNPLPTVQWFKDKINIDDSPDYAITYNNGEAVLKFFEISPDDSAVYTCKATNKLGQASTSADLKVVTDEKTVDVVITNGTSSPILDQHETCEQTSEVKVNIVKEHRIIEESRIVKIETRSEAMGGRTSQVIPDASAQDITTSDKDVITPIKVETVEKSTEMPEFYQTVETIQPSVQLPLKDVQVFEGKTVRLDCVIIGQPEPEVIWYHDNQPVKESADFQLLFQGDRCSLIIHEAFLDDGGKYKVVAINTKGEASSECTLSVISSAEAAKQTATGSAPHFVKLISDVLVSEGDDAVLECEVNGEPRPDLRWYFNNEEIVFINERITMTHDKSGCCTLKICSTTPEDKGNYVAKASNLHGEAKAIARLVIKPSNESLKREELVQMEEKLVPPSFEEVFDDRVITSGSSTKFECIVHGKPMPKIQWLFNDRPVHGKSFLVSVSGDRQVLTIPEVSEEHVGSISCVAENSVGKATCTAQLNVGGEEVTRAIAKGVEDNQVNLVPHDINMQASSSSEKHFTTERRTLPGDVVDEKVISKMSSSIMQSSTTRSSCTKEFTSSTTSSNIIEPSFRPGPGNVVSKTHVESREYSSQQNGGPPVVQSKKVEEFERIVEDSPGHMRQEKTRIITEGSAAPKMAKPTRKNISPRFVTPLTGMIVDQGHDIVLEGVIDGYPLPTITWTKNGQDLKEGVKTTYEHNHVRLELKNVNVRDAGRYTCTAENDVGNASSTADLVVKKTIFPPVFGKRLQAQVVKKGERVLMEVEITGTPEPTVTWYKDDEPLMDTDGTLKQLGNCYLLIIDSAEKRHAGKYMVHAVNAGGEGQSIADFAVFEPTPDTMTEVHKTIVYENVADKNLKLEEKKSELPSAALTAEHIATTTIQPSSTLKTLLPTSSSTSSSQIRKIELIGPKTSNKHTEETVFEKATRSEMISSTIESHQSETKSEQKFHMKLQHQAPLILDSEAPSGVIGPTVTTTTTKINTESTQSGGEPISTKTTEFVETTQTEGLTEDTNENVETSTIAKKDALSFFESMSKDSESTPRGPKAMIKLTEEDTDGNYDVKVDKLTKNYERSTKFEETKKPIPETPSKTSVHGISNKFEAPVITKGVDNVMIDFPYDDYKLPPLNIQRTVLEDTTASGSPIHGTLTISRLVAQSESAEKMLSGFNLVPEPPPEIGYMPKPDDEPMKRTDVSSKAKQLQESQKKTVDAPIGGVKIFPTAPMRMQAPPPVVESKPKPTFIPPPFELGKTESCERKEVVEEMCVKKSAGKRDDIKSSSYSPAPLSPPKTDNVSDKWWSSTSDLETRSHVSTDISDYRCQSGASSHIETRATSPKPSADGLAMEKSWAKSKNTESTRKSWPPPPPSTSSTCENKETTKSFTKREEWREPEVGYKTSTHEKRQEVEETPGGGMTKTNIESSSSLETRSWSTRENHIEQKVTEMSAPPKPIIKPVVAPSAPVKPTQPPVTMYKAETTKVDHIVNAVEEKSVTEKYSSQCEFNKMETSEKFSSYEELKAPGLVKAIPPKPLVQLYHTGGEEPKSEQIKSFQESTSLFKGSLATAPKRPTVQLYHQSHDAPRQSDMILEPGPPPEMGYIPPPPMREKKIERMEKSLEMSLESQPAKIPPGAIRAFPPPPKKRDDAPPIPPKDARKTPPPLPAKKSEPYTIPAQSRQSFPAPVTPCKFTKGQFAESDYESDFESCRSLWRPCESDDGEPKYRRVQAPTPRQPRPKSTEPEPLPPSSFEVPPPQHTGPPRPTVTPDYSVESDTISCKKTSTMMSRNERNTKQQQHYQSQGFAQEPMLPKPGSPPIYVQPKTIASKSPPIRSGKPESPKFKPRNFTQESGYMADTDEPFYQRAMNSNIQKSSGKYDDSSTTSSTFESKQFMESKSYSSSSTSQRMEERSSTTSAFAPTAPVAPTSGPKSQFQRSSYCEKSYASSSIPANTSKGFKPDKEETNYSWSQSQKTSSTQSPSKFARGEFRESDYESDYEGRIPPLWKPRGGSDIEDHSFKPVKPNLSETSWPNTNGVTGTREIIQPYLDILPKKAPLFITPLRDIAVVSGQTARFECIVQAEPQPNTLWSKDGRIVENSNNYEVYYRNGVCRLVIPCASPDDAGTYICTATNSLGSTATSATLQVPGNRRSLYSLK